mmetsp:Transcript_37862/g.117005  ORF Transcript_37862/g.117005 Transcript_37862/m.117005 type:complete len:237 (+) Transcript_37862:2-712(+)
MPVMVVAAHATSSWRRGDDGVVCRGSGCRCSSRGGGRTVPAVGLVAPREIREGEVRVREQLRDGRPRLGIVREAALQQPPPGGALDVRRDARVVVRRPRVADVKEERDGLLDPELRPRQVAADELEKRRRQRPHVAPAAVAPADRLRRHVHDGADDHRRRAARAVDRGLGRAEVAELHDAARVDQHVVRLQISVQDPALVQVLQPKECLVEDAPRGRLAEPPAQRGHQGADGAARH